MESRTGQIIIWQLLRRKNKIQLKVRRRRWRNKLPLRNKKMREIILFSSQINQFLVVQYIHPQLESNQITWHVGLGKRR